MEELPPASLRYMRDKLMDLPIYILERPLNMQIQILKALQFHKVFL